MPPEAIFAALTLYTLGIVFLTFKGRFAVFKDFTDAGLTAVMVVLGLITICPGRIISEDLPAVVVALWLLFAVMAVVSIHNLVAINGGLARGLLVLPAKLLLSAIGAAVAIMAYASVTQAVKKKGNKSDTFSRLSTIAIQGGLMFGVLWLVSRLMPCRPVPRNVAGRADPSPA
jgi:hypothetical protein